MKFYHAENGGRNKLYPVLRGAGCKKFQTHDFPIL